MQELNIDLAIPDDFEWQGLHPDDRRAGDQELMEIVRETIEKNPDMDDIHKGTLHLLVARVGQEYGYIGPPKGAPFDTRFGELNGMVDEIEDSIKRALEDNNWKNLYV